MFSKIWTNIRNFFKPASTTDTTDTIDIRTTIMHDYSTIVRDIHNANSLSQLLSARKNIRKLQQDIINNGKESWGRQLIVDLNKFWKVKYEYWKRKLRGY